MFRRPVKERFIILAISSDSIIDENKSRVMIEKIESCKPSYWRLHDNRDYHIYYRFKNKNSTERANILYREVVELIITNDGFGHFKVGMHEGMMISEVNLIGGVTFEPLGDAVNEAYRLQKGKSDLKSNVYPVSKSI